MSLFPALSVIVLLFVGGLILTFSQSVGFFAAAGESGFRLAAYRQVLLDQEFQSGFVLTLIVASVATALSAVGGFGLAVLVHSQIKRNAGLRSLLQIPLAIPHLATAFILLNIFAPSGLIARFFVSNPQDFPVLVNDGYGIGIITAYVLKETPFIAIVMLAALARTGDEFEQVAQNLGATEWQRLCFVVLPTVAPSLIFSSLIVFAFIFGAFEIPFVLGRQFPAMLAIIGNRKFLSTDLNERPEALALAILMTIAAGFFVWLYLRATESGDEAEGPTLF